MPGGFKICDNHAVKCVTVVTDTPLYEYRGRAIRLCKTCAQNVVDEKRIWLDDVFDAEDADEADKLEHRGYFRKREKEFHAWLDDNPSLWQSFVDRSEEMRAVRDHCSAWLVVNVIRWDRLIKTTGTDFKISNDFIGFLARRYMENDPDRRGGFFDIKPMKGEDIATTKKRCGWRARGRKR